MNEVLVQFLKHLKRESELIQLRALHQAQITSIALAQENYRLRKQLADARSEIHSLSSRVDKLEARPKFYKKGRK